MKRVHGMMVAAMVLPVMLGASAVWSQGGERGDLPPHEGPVWGSSWYSGPGQLVLGDQQTENLAYLGVATSPAGETLRRQLELPRGVGLAVTQVEPGSPAAEAGIRQHDVLHKLNDQLLISTSQLAVLVQMHEPGDSVELTVRRDGRPLTVSAVLGEREQVPAGRGIQPVLPRDFWEHPERLRPLVPRTQEQLERIERQLRDRLDDPAVRELDERLRQTLRQLDRQMERQLRDRLDDPAVRELDERLRQTVAQLERQAGRQLEAIRQRQQGDARPPADPVVPGRVRSSSSLRMRDGEHEIAVERKDGEARLTVEGADGTVIFDGLVPVDEDGRLQLDEVENLPPDIRRKVQRMQTFTLQLDGVPGGPMRIRAAE